MLDGGSDRVWRRDKTRATPCSQRMRHARVTPMHCMRGHHHLASSPLLLGLALEVGECFLLNPLLVVRHVCVNLWVEPASHTVTLRQSRDPRGRTYHVNPSAIVRRHACTAHKEHGEEGAIAPLQRQPQNARPYVKISMDLMWWRQLQGQFGQHDKKCEDHTY